MTLASSSEGLQELSALDIFLGDKYRIPLYQRAYAWTKPEIYTLLVDIRDARKRSESRADGTGPRKYYIGSLVVDTSRSEDEETHEVVDGQQRLTTLFVILSVAPKVLGVPLPPRAARIYQEWKELLASKLTYVGRPDAREDLQRLAQGDGGAISTLNTDGIKNAASLILTAATQGAEEDARERAGESAVDPAGAASKHSAADSPSFRAADFKYLLDHVMILRTNLPPGTDLNHYFEVMNTRGEQLQKHEILKARLMSGLIDDPVDQAIFAQIWDACSILDRHIQVQFAPSTPKSAPERAVLFGKTWDRFIPTSGDDLFETLREARGHGNSDDNSPGVGPSHIALVDVLADASGNARTASSEKDEGKDDDESGSYGAIIDFPNLLLHVLKIFRDEKFSWDVDIDVMAGHVRLEDKYLLEEFSPAIAGDQRGREVFDADAVREFAYTLLKTRFVLDTYVIRTQATPTGGEDDNWVLHRAYGTTQKSKRGLQLRARNTFRATASAVDTEESDDTEAAVQRQVLLLQSMFQVTDTRRQSKYFLFHILQWLCRQDHRETIRGREFIELLESTARDRLTALYSRDSLNVGTQVQNFLFNVLDYELWRLASDPDRMDQILDPTSDVGRVSGTTLKDAAGRFRFRYRTSVEHFYPQEPSQAEGHVRLPQDHVDQFGNLCIMSRSENSKRSNLMPKSKAKEFSSTGQSLNFQLMAAVAANQDWNLEEIELHGTAMTRLLEEVIASHSRGDEQPVDT